MKRMQTWTSLNKSLEAGHELYIHKAHHLREQLKLNDLHQRQNGIQIWCYNIRFSKSVLCSEVHNSYLFTQRMGLFEQPG